MLAKLWSAEPVLVAMLGAGAIWTALFNVLAEFGHTVTVGQQSALIALFVAVAGVIARSQVSPSK